MRRGEAYPAVDLFRMVAAVFVVAIHTAPLHALSPEADTLVTYALGRLAVPFFLATTGFFLLGRARPGSLMASGRFRGQMKKLCALYALSTLLYLPLAWYAGLLPHGLGALARMVLLDGTFYHLWYFPAAIVGCLLTAMLLDRFGLRVALVASGALYLVGLFGDSYYGATAGIEAVRGAYDVLFNGMDYTRNGLFYAPLFLVMGAALAKRGAKRPTGAKAALGLAVCLAALLVEGGLVHALGWVRHDSMYLTLAPATYFLLAVLVDAHPRIDAAWARDASLWMYILHPLCIVGVRGIARATGLAPQVVDDPLEFFVVVCLTSFALALAVSSALHRVRKRRACGRAPLEKGIGA
ncbi:acyltransferase family protein [Eggerthella sinensis]|uniref:acyltransferase family protein n=1 Tax=Eggerthella sinensis TaxID=242230 RepID=UPI00266D9642|nr:acyltransferase [Eggerthella sinensis]